MVTDLQTSPAAIVRAVIDTHCRGDYFTIERETAIRAVAAGRPAVITTGSYHNCAALSASEAVNEGESLIDWIVADQASGRHGERSKHRTFYLHSVLAYLRPLNAAGERAIEEARWFCADAQMAAE